MAAGDHIAVLRYRAVLGLIPVLRHLSRYWHHGIDMGDGTVIHLTGSIKNKKNAEVKRTSLEEFLEGGTKEILNYKGFITRLFMHYELDPPRKRLRTAQPSAVIKIDPVPSLLDDIFSASEQHYREIDRTLPKDPVFTASKIRIIEERINDRERTITEALKHLGEKGYNLLFNNCEHFATFCKTGRRESFQVDEAFWGLSPAKSIERGKAVAKANGQEG